MKSNGNKLYVKSLKCIEYNWRLGNIAFHHEQMQWLASTEEITDSQFQSESK